jgi:Ca2+-transporting ATPase
MVALLAAAAGISLFMGETLDAAAILVVILVNGLIGFLTEYRAERALQALKRMTSPEARVVRGGVPRMVEATELVPGDLLLLEAGDVPAADARIVLASRLAAGEASLTGESVPVEKDPAPLPEPTALADRRNCLFAGTAVVRGTARALVFATGMGTEIGRISALLARVEKSRTPLEERLERFSRFMIWLVLGIGGAVVALGALEGRPILAMLETGIALAVAAVPEGLPFVATMTLAIGVRQMARRRALVRNLSAVETLGSTTVICSDKTGTITENRMTLRVAYPSVEEAVPDLWRAAILCNNGTLGESGEIGDPMETALLRAAREAGFEPEAIRSAEPRLDEEPFDSSTLRMVTTHPAGVAIKGAPERLLEELRFVRGEAGDHVLDERGRETWRERVAELAAGGMRTLAFAVGPDRDRAALVGIAGIVDPPRAEVREAVRACRGAGMRVIMVTGDHLLTARAIAAETGILTEGLRAVSGAEFAALPEDRIAEEARDLAVVARVAPEHKYRLVQALQAAGEVVAMTGDGVNDAPALKASDVGVAMGITGTEVSKEAGDVILKDDRFATIVDAVEEGRRIFDNIRKAILFLLCCNLSEVFTVFLALLANLPTLLSPLQILWINLTTDVVPALALALDPAEPDVMRRRPKRREEDLLTAPLRRRIFQNGLLMTAGVLGAYVLCGILRPGDGGASNEVAFFTLVIAQLLFVFNVRRESFLRDPGQLTGNPSLLIGIGAILLLQAGIAYVPLFREVLDISPLSAGEWACVLAGALFPTAVAQARKLLSRDRALPI